MAASDRLDLQNVQKLASASSAPSHGDTPAVPRQCHMCFHRYEPDAGPRLQNMMTRILHVGDFLEFLAGLLVGWEGPIDEWEPGNDNL